MSPSRIQAIFFSAVVIFGVIIGYIGGLPGWIMATVLIIGGPAMFAYGCHRTKEQTLSEITDVVAPPGHQDSPQSARAAQDHSTSEQSA